MSSQSVVKVLHDASSLDSEFKSIASLFEDKETEQNWIRREEALQKLCAITRGSTDEVGGAAAFASAVKTRLRDAITSSLNSERTRLSRTALLLVEELASHLGTKFETLADSVLPSVLRLTARANKVYVTSAAQTLRIALEHCSTACLIPIFQESLGNPSKSLRITAVECLVKMLGGKLTSVKALHHHLGALEKAIQAAVIDSVPEVRDLGKSLFEAYCLHFPEEMDRFVENLNETQRKYLRIDGQRPVPRPSFKSSFLVNRGKTPFHRRDLASIISSPEREGPSSTPLSKSHHAADRCKDLTSKPSLNAILFAAAEHSGPPAAVKSHTNVESTLANPEQKSFRRIFEMAGLNTPNAGSKPTVSTELWAVRSSTASSDDKVAHHDVLKSTIKPLGSNLKKQTSSIQLPHVSSSTPSHPTVIDHHEQRDKTISHNSHIPSKNHSKSSGDTSSAVDFTELSVKCKSADWAIRIKAFESLHPWSLKSDGKPKSILKALDLAINGTSDPHHKVCVAALRSMNDLVRHYDVLPVFGRLFPPVALLAYSPSNKSKPNVIETATILFQQLSEKYSDESVGSLVKAFNEASIARYKPIYLMALSHCSEVGWRSYLARSAKEISFVTKIASFLDSQHVLKILQKILNAQPEHFWSTMAREKNFCASWKAKLQETEKARETNSSEVDSVDLLDTYKHASIHTDVHPEISTSSHLLSPTRLSFDPVPLPAVMLSLTQNDLCTPFSSSFSTPSKGHSRLPVFSVTPAPADFRESSSPFVSRIPSARPHACVDALVCSTVASTPVPTAAAAAEEEQATRSPEPSTRLMNEDSRPIAVSPAKIHVSSSTTLNTPEKEARESLPSPESEVYAILAVDPDSVPESIEIEDLQHAALDGFVREPIAEDSLAIKTSEGELTDSSHTSLPIVALVDDTMGETLLADNLEDDVFYDVHLNTSVVIASNDSMESPDGSEYHEVASTLHQASEEAVMDRVLDAVDIPETRPISISDFPKTGEQTMHVQQMVSSFLHSIIDEVIQGVEERLNVSDEQIYSGPSIDDGDEDVETNVGSEDLDASGSFVESSSMYPVEEHAYQYAVRTKLKLSQSNVSDIREILLRSVALAEVPVTLDVVVEEARMEAQLRTLKSSLGDELFVAQVLEAIEEERADPAVCFAHLSKNIVAAADQKWIMIVLRHLASSRAVVRMHALDCFRTILAAQGKLGCHSFVCEDGRIGSTYPIAESLLPPTMSSATVQGGDGEVDEASQQRASVQSYFAFLERELGTKPCRALIDMVFNGI